MKPTLLLLAAGMGSRYGGLKQLDGVGPSGETIMDYSIYDAIKAGFGKLVFVIRKYFEDDFRRIVLSKYEGHIPCEVVYQELDNLPEGFTCPADRTKPWGTNHAVMMGESVIHEPFAVINCDDFYGRSSFMAIGEHLSHVDPASRGKYCMVGFRIGNTLSDSGTVSRGLCTTNEQRLLTSVVERTKIQRMDGQVKYLGDDGDPDGFDIALIEAIGEKLGVTVEVMDMEFDSLCTSVGNRIDVAIAGMTVDPEREKTVTFSDTYYKAIQNVLVPADDTAITDMASLEGKVIGVQQGTTGDMIADEIAGADVRRYNTFALAVEDLKNGNLDAVIIDQNPAEVFAGENEGVLKLLGAENFGFTDEYYAIACPKDDTALVASINAALAALQTDGTFDALVAEYIEK